MRVIVCDDNILFLEEMKKMLQARQGIKGIECYKDKVEFIKQFKEDNLCDLVFLNIKWGESCKEEIQFGEDLSDLLNRLPVILLTNNNETFNQKILLSKLNLIGYLVKPIETSVLDKYIEKVKMMNEISYVNISSHGKNIRLQTDDIIHIESHNHKINIFTPKDVYSAYEKINDIKKRLPKEFVQCHKSFMVNLKWVACIDGKRVILRNGKQVSISRTYHKILKDAAERYIREIL